MHALYFVVVAAAFLISCPTAARASDTNALVFQSVVDLLSWERHSPFTNGFEMIYWHEEVRYLPTNFIANLSNEISNPNFKILIMKPPTNLQKPEGMAAFDVAICGGDQMGFVLRANCSMGRDDSPPWIKRLKFYLSSRFDGHSAEYVTQALAEQSSGPKVALPFGFPDVLEQEYWIPSQWIQADTFELDKIDSGVPRDEGPIKMNRLWLVQDGQFAWVYYLDSNRPVSERRDGREYDSKIRDHFESATKEALKTIQERGIRTNIRFALDGEVQRILEQKHAIYWLTPMDLK